MTSQSDILTDLEVILFQLHRGNSEPEDGLYLSTALGGIEVKVEPQIGGLVQSRSGETAPSEPSLGAAPSIVDLVVDYDVSSSGAKDVLELTQLLDMAYPSGNDLSGSQNVNKDTAGLVHSPALSGATSSVIAILYDDGSSHSTNTV